jgi:uncharacterized membrane protein YgdD (TMEM256/DUF423 family)
MESDTPARLFATLGATFALIAVALGAFGAHALQTKLSADDLSTFETGVRYQMYHAFGLFVVAWTATRWPGVWTTTAGWLFTVGILVFSGSLYLLVLTGPRALGAVTPIGGVAFLLGWLSLALGFWRR